LLEQLVAEATLTVFVVDDDASVRTGIESLLNSSNLRVRSFPSAQEFFQRAPSNGPACLVLDIRLPGLGGLELQRALAANEPGLPIVFITGHADIAMTVQAMKAGAVEFLVKPFRDVDLLDAVQLALDTARAWKRQHDELSRLYTLFDSLTPRERQVLDLMVAGRLNKQIAFELGISEVTVKIHRAQVMHKMHAPSFADLVRMCARLVTARRGP
jgi:FixJ family two-component response regulator